MLIARILLLCNKIAEHGQILHAHRDRTLARSDRAQRSY